MIVELSLPDERATLRLGAAFAKGARGGLVLHLSGELGTGKTTLVRGLLSGLGYNGRAKSPTYTLVEPYTISSLHLYHFDLYRFSDEREWLSSGFQEHFGPESLCVVEWPERAGAALPPPDVQVTLEHADGGRRARVRAFSAAGERWLASALARWRSS
ncbi:MAG: tRNA (adenosine(37)-N6)-threonylcarbamoyltransferase complex ATPase subunit type 1 TsaE [Burkholderiales bacterium]|nr:tRNA (adenosine(37)-N6)-threonylcarbamoyltransferase complex ATPase subunit type 1 TsaE [Burkholderiales bacterium]